MPHVYIKDDLHWLASERAILAVQGFHKLWLHVQMIILDLIYFRYCMIEIEFEYLHYGKQ